MLWVPSPHWGRVHGIILNLSRCCPLLLPNVKKPLPPDAGTAEATLQRYQEAMEKKLGEAKTNATPIFTTRILGVARSTMQKQTVLQYLIAEHGRHVWVTEKQLAEIDIGDDVIHMGITVWWEDGTTDSLATPYTGKVISFDQDSGLHELKYDTDHTEEALNLSTLELAPEFAQEGIRTMWILMCDDQEKPLNGTALRQQLQTDMKKAVHHETVQVEKKANQPRGKRKRDEHGDQGEAAAATASVFELDECWIDIDGDPVPVTERTSLRTSRRPKRRQTTVNRFGTQDMMNDKKLRKRDDPC